MIVSASGETSNAETLIRELKIRDGMAQQDAFRQIATHPLQEAGLVSADDVKTFMKQRQAEIYGREHPLLLANASENYASLILGLLNCSAKTPIDPFKFVVDGHLSHQKTLSLLLDVLATAIVSRDTENAAELHSSMIHFLQSQIQDDKFSQSLVDALCAKLQSREEWESLIGLTTSMIESKVVDLRALSLAESSSQIIATIPAQFSKFIRLKHSERSATLFSQGQETTEAPPKILSLAPQTQHQALTESLITRGLYSKAGPMLESFPHFKDLSQAISSSLAAPLSVLLSQLATCRSSQNIRQCLEQILPAIESVGPTIAKTPGVLDSFLRCTQALIEDSDEMLAFVVKYALPMVTVVDFDMPGLNDCTRRLHSILQKFSFSRRSRIYDLWQQEIRKSNRAVDAAMQLAERSTKDCLKRISNQNYQEMVQRLAKVSITSPVSCLSVFISQVENYDKIASLIVQSASVFQPLHWDVLTYVILSQLTSGRKSSQNDGLHNEKWLQALSNFIGRLGAKYSQFRLEPLLQYLSSQLNKGDPSLLVMLSDILHHAGGIPLQNNLTQANIIGLMGTSTQRKLALNMLGMPEARPMAILDFLEPSEIKMNFYKSLCALRRDTYDPDTFEILPSTKLLTHRNDQIHLVTLQYVDLIRWNSPLSNPTDTLVTMLLDGFTLVEAFELTRDHLNIRAFDLKAVGVALKERVSFSLAAMVSDEGLAAFWCMNWNSLPFTPRFSRYILETLHSQDNSQDNSSTDSLELLSQNHLDWVSPSSDDDLNELLFHLLSRAKYSPQNALYVAGFILRVLTRCNDVHFLRLLDALYTSDILLLILESSTLFEVENIGAFLTTLRKMLAIDSRDWVLFEQEYMGFPSSGEGELEDDKIDLASLNLAFRRRELESTTDVTTSDDLFTEEELESSTRVWDYCLGETIENGLDKASFITRQNSIILLRSLSSVFPTYATIGDTLLSKVDNVANTDHRDDLKLASTALTIQFKRASSSWISLDDLPSIGMLQSEVSPQVDRQQDSPNSDGGSASPSRDGDLAGPEKLSDQSNKSASIGQGENDVAEADLLKRSSRSSRGRGNRRQRNRNGENRFSEGDRDENRRDFDSRDGGRRDNDSLRSQSGRREDNGRRESRNRNESRRGADGRRSDMRNDDLMPSQGNGGSDGRQQGWRRDSSRRSGNSDFAHGRTSGGHSLPSRPDRDPRNEPQDGRSREGEYRDSYSDRRNHRTGDRGPRSREGQNSGSGDSGSRQSSRGSNRWRQNKRGYDGGDGSRKRFRS